MKNLILIRHGKSDWAQGLSDHSRPLADRGFADAAMVAQKAIHLYDPNAQIVSSSAERAFSTARIFASQWKVFDDAISVNRAFYTFSALELEAALSTVCDSVQTLFIFGHNEAITDFVNKFGNIYIDNVPTSGLVELHLPTDSWRHPKPGTTGTVIFPKELKHGQ